MNKIVTLSLLCLLAVACQDLDLNPNLNADREEVIRTGADLRQVLQQGYEQWWGSIHHPVPAISLGVAADAFALPWDDFGADRMGQEPRVAYANRESEPEAYQNIAARPWFGLLAAVTDANDVLRALEAGISIDKGGPQDQSIEAAALMLRGISWGYLGLLFDQAPLVRESDDLSAKLEFSPYSAVTAAAATELEAAAELSAQAGIDFIHDNFNGLVLDGAAFQELCYAYAARFLAQAARTPQENEATDWARVAAFAEQGLTYDFAPTANGGSWTSYQTYTLANTGQGPFWARVDQRLVAALDPTQPARYPEVEAQGEAPLAETEASTDDARIDSDFLYAENIFFPAAEGEWHFSHYLHQRNASQPDFMGDGQSGPMPTFLQADNELLLAEALLRTNRKTEAIQRINQGSRVNRGNLSALSNNALEGIVLQSIYYERAIELFNTAPFSLWLDRRRWAEREAFTELSPLGGLQEGTPAQLPVPVSELLINGMEVYSFGGVQDPEGIIPFFY
jgi:hypothetical protein